MRLDDERESDNIEDRRGDGGGFSMGGGSISIGAIALALVASYIFGIDPSTLLGLTSNPGQTRVATSARKPPPDDDMSRFVSKVLADTEDTWQTIFSESGKTYCNPKLVLFTGSTPTACSRSTMGQTVSSIEASASRPNMVV